MRVQIFSVSNNYLPQNVSPLGHSAEQMLQTSGFRIKTALFWGLILSKRTNRTENKLEFLLQDHFRITAVYVQLLDEYMEPEVLGINWLCCWYRLSSWWHRFNTARCLIWWGASSGNLVWNIVFSYQAQEEKIGRTGVNKRGTKIIWRILLFWRCFTYRWRFLGKRW